jgi:predicted deacylase
MNTSQIHSYSYSSEKSGLNLLVFGAIHGDEICGPKAIEQVMTLLNQQEIKLISGQITFVPICNPRAYAENKRFIEENLNRVFKPTQNPRTYESTLANELCQLVDRADVLFDIHSFRAAGPTNVFLDFPTEQNRKHVEALDFEYALVGWPKLYEQNPYLDSYDTTQYANSVGKQGILIECGQHSDPEAIVVAKETILKTLEHLEMIVPREEAPKKKNRLRSIRMTQLELKNEDGDHFLETWEHLQPVPAGMSIAMRASGESLSVSVDSIILLPKHTAKPGEEWFYVGVEETE